MANKLEPIGKSSLGMDENLVALLAIAFSPITAIIFLVMEKESKFVKFHSIQSLVVVVFTFVLYTVLGMIPILGWMMIPFVGIGVFVLWIVMLIKAYQGEWFELPIAGKFSMEQVNK